MSVASGRAPTRRGRRWAHARRPGFSYMMFLVTATIVVLIGLAASAVVRAEMRSAASEGDLARARANAISALERAESEIYTNRSWRSAFSDGAWSDDKQTGDGSFRWLVADADTARKDLTADPAGYARLYGRGASGDAVWVYSVLMRPPPTKESVEAGIVGLVGNGSFTGPSTAGWSPTNANLNAKDNRSQGSGGASSSGEPSLIVNGRLLLTSSADYVLDAPLVQGRTYAWSFEMRMLTLPERGWARITVKTSSGDHVIELLDGTVSTDWETFSGSFTPSWSGDFVSATLSFGTSVSLQHFFLDGVKVTSVVSTAIGPVPGSLRRETP